MGDASFTQTSFLGGQWSQFYQGRMDHPRYKTAMAVCQNAYPIEEGSCPRRPGFQFAAQTRAGVQGLLKPFVFEEAAPYICEFTNGHLRFFNGPNLVFTEDAAPLVSNISTANPAVITLESAVTWSTGDAVQLFFNNLDSPGSGAPLYNRQVFITVIDTTHFSIQDNVTGANISGANMNWANGTQCVALRILDIPTPYTNATLSPQNLRIIQNETISLVLNSGIAPNSLVVTPNSGSTQFADFTLSALEFLDGPYLDPIPGSQGQASAVSGNITLTINFAAYSSTVTYAIGDQVLYGAFAYVCIKAPALNQQPDISSTYWTAESPGCAVYNQNGIVGFQTTDVGRLIRIFSEPPVWSSSANYVAGNTVEYPIGSGAYYIALGNSTNVVPDISPNSWAPSTTIFTWTWGTITSYVAVNEVTVLLQGPPLVGYGSGVPIRTWQLGVYSDTTGWPTAGCFYEGRFWLTGAVPNRFDASMSGGITINATGSSLAMSPTGTGNPAVQDDGTVNDNNGISYTFDSSEQNPIFWMQPNQSGIVCGTLGGEWLIQATTAGNILTATDIQAHRVTKYGCANIEPRPTGISLVFVQKYARKVMEFLADVFTGRFMAPNLSLVAKDQTQNFVQEIWYQEELAPILWARNGDDTLHGATYRRISAFTTEEPAFVAWHEHFHGTGQRDFESICVGPTPDGTLDSLACITNATQSGDPSQNVRWVEIATTLFDEGDILAEGWFLDGAVNPAWAPGTINGVGLIPYTGIWVYGLGYAAGQNVDVTGGGLDLGTYLVPSDDSGTIFIPFGANGQTLFTLAYLNNVTASLGSASSGSITVTPATGTPGGYGTIQDYVASGKTFNSNFILPYFPANTACLIDNTDDAFDIFNLATGAIITGPVTTTTLGTADPSFDWAVDPDGNMYWSNDASHNSNPMVQVAQNLTLTRSYGNASIATVYGNNDFVVPVSMACSRTTSGKGVSNDYLLSIADTKSWGIFLVGAASAITFVGNGSVNESSGNVWQGSINTDPCTWFGCDNNGYVYGWSLLDGLPNGSIATVKGGFLGSILNYLFGLCSGSEPTPTAPQIVFNVIGQVTPSSVAAGATTINDMGGGLYDQQDGNLIIQVHVLGGANAGNYICKVSSADASVLWAVPITGGLDYTQMNKGNCQNGLYTFISPAAYGSDILEVYQIDTLSGQWIAVEVPGLAYSAATQCSNDANRSVLGYFSAYLSTTTGAPVPLNSTASFTNEWAELIIGTGDTRIGGTLSGLPPGHPKVTITPGTGTFGTGFSGQREVISGFTYTTKGQLLRPYLPQDTGSRIGPAFGMKRRIHRYAALFAQAIRNTVTAGVNGVSVGTSFSNLRPVMFKQLNGVAYDNQTMYNGVWSDTCADDTYGFDGQLCWQITRPVPCTVSALGGFISSEPE